MMFTGYLFILLKNLRGGVNNIIKAMHGSQDTQVLTGRYYSLAILELY